MHSPKLAACFLCVASLFPGPARAADELKKEFANPPDSARPWVFFALINGNITKEGLTADLEAMKRVGLGGAMIMEVTRSEPAGPVKFMSDEWRSLFKHLITEADRLNLKIDMNNAAGWSGSGGPWIPLDKSMQEVVASETAVTGGRKFEGVLPPPPSNGDYHDIVVLAVPTTEAIPFQLSGKEKTPFDEWMRKTVSWKQLPGSLSAPVAPVPAGKIINLTDKMDAAGKLTWDAPAGQWTVIRFGNTFTKSYPQEAPGSGSGPECDKLSPDGIEANFDGMMKKLVQDVGPLAGKSLYSTHIDSWEVGSQNWTARMPEEFKQRRGYDLTPFLPTLTGRVVDSPEVAERFLWDWRKTISELAAENHTRRMQQLAKENGLRFSMECYNTTGDDMELAQYIDTPVAEFWWPTYALGQSVKQMSSISHINGLPITACESFTAQKDERWLAHPAKLKALGDRALADGANNIWFHCYAHQPWNNIKPGMAMGLFGGHYDRNQTWWEDARAWHEYIARCQVMLRQGHYDADALFLLPDEPMQRYSRNPELPGYGYDVIGVQHFINQASVKDGSIVFPSGMSYRLLVLPDSKTMSISLLQKIRDLVSAGAVILGPPPEATPSLTNYPKADAQLRKMTAEIWGAQLSPDHTFGQGRVLTGQTPVQALGALGVKPDFSAEGQQLNWTHRTDGDREIYFVANPSNNAFEINCTFRVSGKQPELWNPATGEIFELPRYTLGSGQVVVPLKFWATDSYFIVFRKPADPATQVVSVTRDGQPYGELDWMHRLATQDGRYVLKFANGQEKEFQVPSLPAPQAIEGAWDVAFAPGWGAPPKATFDKLISWSDSPDAGIKYFSGTGTYTKTFQVAADQVAPGRRLFLDLGNVQVMAVPRLNGKNLGILWRAPFRVDITDAVKVGENKLEIPVVNLWVNRLIGDEELPEEGERSPAGLAIKQWPQWIVEGKPNPTGRYTYVSYRLWKKGEALQPSGLLGPVHILFAASIPNE